MLTLIPRVDRLERRGFMHANVGLRGLVLTLPLLFFVGCFPDHSALEKEEAEDRAAEQSMNRTHMDGVLRLNDAPFAFQSCSSGEIAGFKGVELRGKDGSRLRLVEEVDGTGTVIRMSAAADPITIKACGTIVVGPSFRFGHDAAWGIARLDCSSGSLRIAGSVSFVCRNGPEG